MGNDETAAPMTGSSGDEAAGRTDDSWYDDTPITDAQYASVWDSAMAVQERPNYSRHIVRKLLAEVDRLREAQAGGVRSWEAQQEIIQKERRRAETAEAELAKVRAELGEVETQWTLGDEHGPYDGTNNVRPEADVRFWANEPDSTSRAWQRLVGEWRKAEEGGDDA